MMKSETRADAAPDGEPSANLRKVHQAHMAMRLLAMANMLLGEGYTRAEIAATMIDMGAHVGALVDPVGFAERCLATARVLARRAEEHAAAQNIHSSPGGLQ